MYILKMHFLRKQTCSVELGQSAITKNTLLHKPAILAPASKGRFLSGAIISISGQWETLSAGAISGQ